MIIATSNQGKLKKIGRILSEYRIYSLEEKGYQYKCCRGLK